MKICFEGIEHEIVFSDSSVSVLQIESKILFTRMCQSLLSGRGTDALEPYTLWADDGKRLKSGLIAISDPFNLPWKHKQLGGKLFHEISNLACEEEEYRGELFKLNSMLSAKITEIGFQLYGDYGFKLEWDVCSYLKAFDFNLLLDENASLLESLIGFIELAQDMHYSEALLFINLSVFLNDSDLQELFNCIFSSRIPTLLLENNVRSTTLIHENKLIVDQAFLETVSSAQSDCSSSSQGRFCSNGFGAVTL